MKRLAAVAVALTSLLALGYSASPARAQSYDFTASLLGGLGGSFDANPDPGFGNLGLQLGFSFVADRQTQVGFRLGSVDFGEGPLETLYDSSLLYLSAAGEYRFTESYYESGVFFGLGIYSLDGTLASGESADETALGLVLGILGDFEINNRFSILVELAGHFTDLDAVRTFGTGLVGVTYRF